MKLKIAICDDDANQRDYLVGITAAWAGRMRHLAQVRIYSRAEDFLFDYGEEKDFDILLLDVEMPGMSGVELAKLLDNAMEACMELPPEGRKRAASAPPEGRDAAWALAGWTQS